MMIRLIAAGLLCGCWVNAQSLKLDTESFDFGKITDQEKVTYRLGFENSGDKELVISEVKPSCGCTTGKPDKSAYAPGQRGFVDITFNPARRVGKISKYVTFKSNAVNEKSKRVKFQAEVVPLWLFLPRRFDFRQKASKDGFARPIQTLLIQNNSEDTATLVLKSQNEHITVGETASFELKPGEQKSVPISVDETFVPTKNIYSAIHVTTKVGEKEQTQLLTTSIKPPRRSPKPRKK